MNTFEHKKILVTGATGFLGGYAIPFLREHLEVKTISLRQPQDFLPALNDIDIILFLTGIAHQSNKTDEQLYYRVNRDLVVDFASQAKNTGVKHFIYVSSIKVYGEGGDTIYNEHSACNPSDAYGKSKFEAEQRLLALADEQFIVSIIRPAVVYGKGVKGNIKRIIDLVNHLPILPFGGIHNKRSMVYIGNFLELMKKIIDEKARGIFISSDSELHSTSELIREINRNRDYPKKIIYFPGFLKQIIHIFKPGMYLRLFDDFIVDNSITNKKLNFSPPYSFAEGIQQMMSENQISTIHKPDVPV